MSKTSDLSRTRAESFRVPIDCVVDLRLDPSGDWKRTTATNISMSGMFLRTAEMHSAGSALDIKLELQDGQPAIRARVEVLWSRVGDSGLEKPQGLGVRFLDLDLESKYAISRLVDRYQQLGRMPFHLATPEDELQARGRRSWGRRGALALAFLAGAVAGAAGFWLFTKSGPDTETGATNIAQASGLMSKSAPHPDPLPQGEREPDVVPSDPVTEIESAIDAWAEAWAAKDVERYLAAYSVDFAPASGLSRDAWESQRRQRLGRAGAVEIGVTALEVEALDPDRAVARFDQAYKAPGYRDRVRKQLELVRQDQEWKIVGEVIQAELPVE